VGEVLPKRKQVIALSATYTPPLLAEVESLMAHPQHVMLCTDTVSLLGVRQFYSLLPGWRAPTAALSSGAWKGPTTKGRACFACLSVCPSARTMDRVPCLSASPVGCAHEWGRSVL
jgi:hypothetical protein